MSRGVTGVERDGQRARVISGDKGRFPFTPQPWKEGGQKETGGGGEDEAGRVAPFKNNSSTRRPPQPGPVDGLARRGGGL